jgi:hypothetical protein
MYLLFGVLNPPLEFISLTRNRVLARDALAKRRKVEDEGCMFCADKESVQHVFFDCVVAKQCWVLI